MEMSFIKSDILRLTREGLYCEAGDFHIDPWRPVKRAVITHAHADHARTGMEAYYCASRGVSLLRERVGKKVDLEEHAFGEAFELGSAKISFHPAGHILGSAQVRIETEDQVAVVTGDHNATHAHEAAEPFEPVACDLLVTESTFGLPIYQWADPDEVMEAIRDWWARNRARGITSVLPCYPLGKTQRILGGLAGVEAPIAVVGSARPFLDLYGRLGVDLPSVLDLTTETVPLLKGVGLVLISFSGSEPALLKRLKPLSWGSASGWMQIRGVRRSRDYDRGFVLSDHSDWDGLMRCVRESGARRIGVTHGQTEVFARYLRENGWDAFPVATHFEAGGH
jgi:putative mRNA 3-end processing factor